MTAQIIHEGPQINTLSKQTNYIILNPLSAGTEYSHFSCFYEHIKYHFVNVLKIKRDIKISKSLTYILSYLNNLSLT